MTDGAQILKSIVFGIATPAVYLAGSELESRSEDYIDYSDLNLEDARGAKRTKKTWGKWLGNGGKVIGKALRYGATPLLAIDSIFNISGVRSGNESATQTYENLGTYGVSALTSLVGAVVHDKKMDERNF